MPTSSKPFDFTTREGRQRFYRRAAWRKARRVYLDENPWCERCLEKHHVFPAQHVHHVADIADRPDLALDPRNFEALDDACHNAETARRRARGLVA